MKVTLEQIESFQLFSKLSKTELEELMPMFETVTFKAGDRVFKECEAGDSMYLILSGSVDIRKCIDFECGTEKSLATLPKGDFFGEMSLLTGESRSASVLVLEDALLLKILRDKYIDLMTKNPSMTSLLLGGLVSSISKRLRATSLESVTLYETGRIISNTKNVKDLSAKILDRLIKSTGAEAGVILFWNEIVECFEIETILGNKNETLATAFNGHSKFSEFLLGLKDPFVTDENHKFVEIKETGLDCKGMVYVPLLTDLLDLNDPYKYVKKVTGVIILGHSNLNHFTLSNLTLMKGVAEQVAQALLNAKLLQENESRRAYEQVYVTPGF